MFWKADGAGWDLEKYNSKVKSVRKKLTFNEKFEYENLEKDLENLESEKKELEQFSP